jgi:hypothetical protein
LAAGTPKAGAVEDSAGEGALKTWGKTRWKNDFIDTL